jgi:hypothetical protein
MHYSKQVDHTEARVSTRLSEVDEPPILVPSGLPTMVTRAWVVFLRTIGDALRDDGKDRETRLRVSRSISALVPHDEFIIGRADPDGGMVWIRPTDDHHHGDMPPPAEPIDDPLVSRVLRDGLPSHEPQRLIVPLRLGSQLTGVADMRHRDSWSYSEDHLAAACLIGEQLGPMIELMFQYKQEEQGRKRLASLIEISSAISHSLDLDQVLPVMGRSLMEALNPQPH